MPRFPTRYGRFAIYGFKGDGPLEEAVALVRGKVNGKTARCAGPFSVLDRRRTHVASLRLPRTTRAFDEKKSAGPPRESCSIFRKRAAASG